MGSEPRPRPGTQVPGGPGVPIQRPLDPSVPPDWLHVPEFETQAERVDRLAGDYLLVTDLGFQQFEGPDYEVFALELAKYGMAVLAAWMRQGLIWERCKARGYGGLPILERDFSRDEIEELTGETVAKALDRFRTDVLMTGRWDYRRGASLRTFFVGQCLIRFANVYRRWWGYEQRHGLHSLSASDDDVELFVRDRPGGDPAAMAVDRVLVDDAVPRIKDPRLRRAVFLREQQWTQAEIAGALGVTVKTVERMFANQRNRWKRTA